MKLIFGLGNPGDEYKNTRHNVGFIFVHELIKLYGVIKNHKTKFNSKYYGPVNIKGKKVMLIIPETYMNRSGSSVIGFNNFFKLPIRKTIVIHDEVDIPLGKIKVKVGGGNAGHNGLKSIDQMIGQNYLRIRIGIGRPENKNMDIASYVLQDFSQAEMNILQNVINVAIKNLDLLFVDDLKTEDIGTFLSNCAKLFS